MTCKRTLRRQKLNKRFAGIAPNIQVAFVTNVTVPYSSRGMICVCFSAWLPHCFTRLLWHTWLLVLLLDWLSNYVLFALVFRTWPETESSKGHNLSSLRATAEFYGLNRKRFLLW